MTMSADRGDIDAQAVQYASAVDGSIDDPQSIDEAAKPRKKFDPTICVVVLVVLPWVTFTVVSIVLIAWASFDYRSGKMAVYELFDDSFGRLLFWRMYITLVLIVPPWTAFLLGSDYRKSRIIPVIVMLGMAAAYTYLFPSVTKGAHAQVSEWQQLPYPASTAEEAIKTTYDTAYCVRVSRETCKDMSVEDATPLFNLTGWTQSTAYTNVNALCDANPGNDLAVCKSCETVKKSDGKVSRWAVYEGRYDEGVKWCGLYFGATSVSADDQSFSPYLYRRTWLLKRMAKSTMDYIILDMVLGVSTSWMALEVCVLFVSCVWSDWKEAKERKKTKESKEIENGTDGYVEHVEA